MPLEYQKDINDTSAKDSYLFNDNSTPSERENVVAFETMINDRKTTLE
jgi:hypothetical protein